MIIIYNLIQLLLTPLLLCTLPLLLLFKPQKRATILSRLGMNLKLADRHTVGSTVIWVHALSVGEITSALPLLLELRRQTPASLVILSASTTSGMKLAQEKARDVTDAIIFFPYDILPIVIRFIKKIQPDLFILVETDFWPNILSLLKKSSVPMLLVNGRISAKSMRSYQYFPSFFRTIFNSFDLLCMQTTADTRQMERLGIAKDKLKTIGNLKYADNWSTDQEKKNLFVRSSRESLLILCGSTHSGEESVLISCYAHLKSIHENIHLAIAPRNPSRGPEVQTLASDNGLTTEYFSRRQNSFLDVTIIDTIGDLPFLFSNADIAFIGGSLVPEGGHNPLEAARQGCPVLFGPNMQDFQEIRDELVEKGGAFEVTDEPSLLALLERFISNPGLRQRTGTNARQCVEQHYDVIPAHLEIIKQFL